MALLLIGVLISAVDIKPSLKRRPQTPQYIGDKWAFNDTSEWSKFAYLDGDKTRLIIRVADDDPASLTELEKTAAKHHAEIVSNVSIRGQVRAVVVELPLDLVSAFVENMCVLNLVSYIEPDLKFQVQFVPNDPNWVKQWGPKKIQANWAWDTTIGNSSILVAVVDTGIDYTHHDLTVNYVPLGYDWVNNDTDPLDDFGHGTHCAGIIAAVLNNSVGIAGLAQVRVMAEKVLDMWGTGCAEWVAKGIIHATDMGANIISMSFGANFHNNLVYEAIKYAYDSGVLLVASAGNGDTNEAFYPAYYDEVIAVAATDQYDNKASFSNWGDWIELAAPGVNIYSTTPTYCATINYYGYSMNYSYMSGTSMACPHVSGVAALIWSQYPNATRDWVRDRLRYAVDDLGNTGFDEYYGYGRINARKAVAQIPDHDILILGVKRTRHIYPGYSACFNVSISNFGANSEENVEAQLLVNGIISDSKTIPYLANGTLTTVSLSWNPLVEGTYNVTLFVVPVSGETIIENNAVSETITIRSIIGHVTFEEAHSPAYTIEEVTGGYSEFADYLARNGYLISTIDPGTVLNSSVLASVEVLIIVAPINAYSTSELSAIENWVKDGGRLLLISDTDYWGIQARAIAEMFGIVLSGDIICDSDENSWGYPFFPYYDGENLLVHPITTGVTRVEMYASDGIISAPASETPLIVTDSDGTAYWYSSNTTADGISVMSAFEGGTVGSGKLIIITDSDLWNSVYDWDCDGNADFYDSDNKLLALNSVNWLAYHCAYNVAVTSVSTLKTVVGQGCSLNINVTAVNQGDYTETFNVTLYANTTEIETREITLSSATSTTLTFTWNTTGFAKGNYTIWAYAWPVLGETYTADNTFVDGWVIVSIAGDITGGPDGWPDGKCDGKDVRAVAILFGVRYPDPKYNPNCDLIYDLKIDGKDIREVAKNYGNKDP